MHELANPPLLSAQNDKGLSPDQPSTLFLWRGGRPFLFLTEEALLLLLPLLTDILSSSPPVTSEFRYEISGSHTSSLLSIICSVRNFSK